MNHDNDFEHVLHVAHHEWHGIRQATAYAPGQKLLISAEAVPSIEDKGAIGDEIEKRRIDRVVFQGYSESSDQLLLYLRARFGKELRCFALTHVSTAQFENPFETGMLARLFMRKRYGQIDRLGSVKPDFSSAFEEYWPGLILNFAPNIPEGSFPRAADAANVYVPLDPGWRKNMHTNILAAALARNVERVKTANFPNGLESLYDLRKLRLVGYLRGTELFAEMAGSTLVLLATLAECQPMTQLEALAVGTPAMTGPLYIKDFAEDPLVQLCSSDKLDNPAFLARDVERVVEAARRDPAAMAEMIRAHLKHRRRIALERYAEFLEP